MFSVLYSFWIASTLAIDRELTRELAEQLLAMAEKQGATVPLMIGHRAMGISLLSTGHICGRARALRSLDSALRACRASSAGHAIWPRRPGGSLVLSVGDLVVAWPSRCRTCRHKTRTHGCARDGPSCHFDVCAGLRIYVSYPPRELRGSKRATRGSHSVGGGKRRLRLEDARTVVEGEAFWPDR